MVRGLFIAVVDAVLHRFLPLFLVDIDNPKSSASRESSVCTLKNFSLTNITHSLIIELPPFVVLVVFNKIEIVASISVAFVHTHCVQVIRTMRILLNVFKDIFPPLLPFNYLVFNHFFGL